MSTTIVTCSVHDHGPGGPNKDERSPDHSTCRNCGEEVVWDDWCYTHARNGWAECNVTFSPPTARPSKPVEDLVVRAVEGTGISVVFDPVITRTGPAMNAEPVEWNSTVLPHDFYAEKGL